MIYIWLIIIMNLPIILIMYMIYLINKKMSMNPIKLLITIISYLLMMNFYLFKIINPLYLMMIMLMYISGLFILFAYFTSLINNTMNLLKNNKFTFMVLILMSLMFLNYNLNNKLNSNFKYKILKLFKIYKISNNLFIIMIMTILLLILIMCIKMCMIKKLALRQPKKNAS